jgi:hypothetical protein
MIGKGQFAGDVLPFQQFAKFASLSEIAKTDNRRQKIFRQNLLS